MGVRKKNMADQLKAAKKQRAFAKLTNCPTSPRKMRLMADLVRGEKIDKALNLLKFSSKEASRRLEKLLLSEIANWQFSCRFSFSCRVAEPFDFFCQRGDKCLHFLYFQR